MAFEYAHTSENQVEFFGPLLAAATVFPEHTRYVATSVIQALSVYINKTSDLRALTLLVYHPHNAPTRFSKLMLQQLQTLTIHMHRRELRSDQLLRALYTNRDAFSALKTLDFRGRATWSILSPMDGTTLDDASVLAL